jgi:hypothetical protein
MRRRDGPMSRFGPFHDIILLRPDEVTPRDEVIGAGYAALLMEDDGKRAFREVVEDLYLPPGGSDRERVLRALEDGRIVAVQERWAYDARRDPRVSVAAPVAPAIALGPVEDDFLQVLLFDSVGDPIPSSLDPFSVTFDTTLANGMPFKGTKVSGGVGRIASIPGGGPSTCSVTFQGATVRKDPVPSEAPPVGPPKVAVSMVRGSLFGPTLVTRAELAATQSAYVNATNVFQLRRRRAEVIECEHFNDGVWCSFRGIRPLR